MSFFSKIILVNKPSLFLTIMLGLSSFLLFILNFYVGYEAIQQFKVDGWSFLGGFFILSVYVITIPANILSFLSIKWVRENRKNKFIIPTILGITGILIGFILYNAFDYWILIIIFNVFLLISIFICDRKKIDKSILPNDKIDQKTTIKNKMDLDDNITVGSNNSDTIFDFEKIKVIQLVGLVLTFPFILGILLFLSVDISILERIMFLLVFILHVFVTRAFFMKKKWSIKVKLTINYFFLGITVLTFLSFIITDGISFSNKFFAILFFFVLLIIFFVFLIYNYKKLLRSGLFLSVILLTIILLSTHLLFAQKNNQVKELYLLDKNDFNPYVEFISNDITDLFNPGNSSRYPSVNLFDGFFKTCWIAGNSLSLKTSSLYINVPASIDVSKINLNIFSGYGKSKKLYYANARPKKIKLSIFAGFYPEGFSTEVVSLYLIDKFNSETIELADIFGVQTFRLSLNKPDFRNFQNKIKENCKTFSGKKYNNLKFTDNPKLFSSLILKIEILSSYPGTKYNDICISEIFFNDRFVTPYPDKYNSISKVYIKNNNTLMVDYSDKKGVIIIKDTLSVFTMIDHPQHSNWAILHYVPNNSVGKGANIKELYKLVDLKNKSVVEKKFEECTGQYPLFIKKNKEGKTMVEPFDGKYEIELK